MKTVNQKALKSFRRNESGATAVEAALCLPIVLMLGFTIIQYGIFYNQSTDLNDRFQKASRQIKLLEYPDENQLTALYQNILGDDADKVTFSVQRVSRYGEKFAEVNMSYAHSIDLPFVRDYPLQANYQNLVLLSGEETVDS